MLFLMTLMCGAQGQAAPPTHVAGTAWTLDASDDWSPGHVTWLQQLAVELPRSMTHPPRPLVLRKSVAPALPDRDLTVPHVLVEVAQSGKALDLRIEGLQQQVDSWRKAHANDRDTDELAQALLRRQLVHALTHVVDGAEGWSRSKEWRVIAGWGTTVRRRKPSESNIRTYGTVHGDKSPREDLATAMERALVADQLPGDLPGEPACRMPSKWRTMANHAELPLSLEADCLSLAQVGLDPAQVDHLEVLFFRASLGHVASVAGHSAVAVMHRPDERGLVRRDAYTLSARTPSNGGVFYAVRGVLGGWGSSVSSQPYRRMLNLYANQENRDTWRYRLLLDDAELTAATERLHELRAGADKPYFFFHRNCGQLPRELAEAALGHRLRLPPVMGPDALLAALDRAEHIEWVAPTGLEEFSVTHRTHRARALQAEAGERLVQSAPSDAGPLEGWLRDIRRAAPEARAEAYVQLANHFKTPTLAQAADVDRVIAFADLQEQLWMSGEEQLAEMLNALRQAKSDNRQTAREQGHDIVSVSDPRKELLDALSRSAPAGSRHTSLRRFALGAMMLDVGDGWTPWTTLDLDGYDSRLGESRRYSLAEGLALSFLDLRAAVRVDGPLDLQARGSLLGLQHVRSSAPMLNAASYMRILEGELQGVRSAQAGATWLEGGLGLELLQSGSHRHHILVTAGAAAQSQFSGAQTPWLGSHGVGLPVRVQGVAGSARQALTHLQLEAGWQPVFAWPTSWLERSARARIGLRIAEVMRHDIALLGEARIVERARMDDPETRWSTRQIGVQVLFEPF